MIVLISIYFQAIRDRSHRQAFLLLLVDQESFHLHRHDGTNRRVHQQLQESLEAFPRFLSLTVYQARVALCVRVLFDKLAITKMYKIKVIRNIQSCKHLQINFLGLGATSMCNRDRRKFCLFLYLFLLNFHFN